MAYGYTGKILVADLTSGTVTVDEHDDAWYRKYRVAPRWPWITSCAAFHRR